MNRVIQLALVACPMLATAGCGLLSDLLNVNQSAVRLVNDGDFDVRVVLFFGDDQDAPREVLTALGTRMEFTLAPGEATGFSRDCGELQAVVIDQAELRVIGSVGPEADSPVLRDGDDFDCRDTITFTFDHPAVPTELTISSDVRPG